MAKKGHSPEQIVRKLRQAGGDAGCRSHGPGGSKSTGHQKPFEKGYEKAPSVDLAGYTEHEKGLLDALWGYAAGPFDHFRTVSQRGHLPPLEGLLRRDKLQ